MKARKRIRHIVIPDCQVKPGEDMSHLDWVGNYIAAKRPDVVVNLGDFADMPSMSGYDVGKAAAEGQRYAADVAAVRAADKRLTRPWRKLDCRRELLLGNHENRINREREAQPRFRDTLSVKDLGFEANGWRVRPFLEVVTIDGIDYSHYFTSGEMGRPVSSAAALLRVRHRSAVMGHVQRRDVAIHRETQHTAVFAGICYRSPQAYLGPQGNVQRPGIWMFNEVRDGVFDPMFVSLEFLAEEYS